MTIIILSIFAVLCIIIGGFFSGAETAFVSTDKSMLRSLAGKKNKNALAAEEILTKPSRMLATTLIGTNLFYVCATTLVTLIVADFVPREWQSVIATLIMTPVLLVFAELVPKSIGRSNSQNYTLAAAPVISFAQKILKPFVVTVSFLSSGALRLFGVKESHNRFSVTREEVRTLAEISAEHGLIGDVEKKMINRVFELNTTTLATAMVPLVNLVSIPIISTIDEALDATQNSGYFKLPVYEERNHNIIGLVRANDLLDASLSVLNGDSETKLANLVDRTIPFMPETKLVGAALKELRDEETEDIFVIDEYGGVTGMVTMHDIAEEIAGDLAIDKDDDKPFMIAHNNEIDCEGRVEVDDITEKFGIKFDKDGYETIAGLVLKLAGKVPARGEVFEYKGNKITVLRADKKRVIRVRLTVPEK